MGRQDYIPHTHGRRGWPHGLVVVQEMSKLKGTTYYELAALTGSKGFADIGYNTTATFWENGRVVIKLHHSNIAMVMSSGVVAIRHCDWPTTITMDRLRQLVPTGWRISNRERSPIAYCVNPDSPESILTQTPIAPYDWLLLYNRSYKYSIKRYPDWERAPD